jgi:hypothetical protein
MAVKNPKIIIGAIIKAVRRLERGAIKDICRK